MSFRAPSSRQSAAPTVLPFCESTQLGAGSVVDIHIVEHHPDRCARPTVIQGLRMHFMAESKRVLRPGSNIRRNAVAEVMCMHLGRHESHAGDVDGIGRIPIGRISVHLMANTIVVNADIEVAPGKAVVEARADERCHVFR